MKKNIFLACLLSTFSLLVANSLSLADNGDGTFNVDYSSDTAIGGFQFNIDDATVNSASGGDATANGFFTSTSATTVLGFSLSGGTIPAGSGTLVVLDLTGTPSGLSGIVMSDSNGQALDFTFEMPDVEITGGCDLPDLNMFLAEDGSVWYNSSEEIGGFQFTIDGTTASSGSGGDAGDAGFMISVGGSTVLGFSLSGATFGPGCGTMVVLTLNGVATGLSGIVMSDPNGQAISFEYFEDGGTDPIYGCMDPGACNFDPEATVDDDSCWIAEEGFDCDGNCVVGEDCTGICGGTTEEDECGICDGNGSSCADCNGVPNGPGIEDNCGVCDPDPTNDCTQDCNGDWGGTAAEDECGICDGDNLSCADCNGVPNGSGMEDNCGVCDPDPSNDCEEDCNGDWGGSAEEDECGVCAGDGSSCSGENVPDWEDNPGAYEFTATISGGIVQNEGVQMGDDGDMFAAFDADGNVRGVAIQLFPPFGPYEGTPVYEMQMRSNAEGDLLHFKYYDASEDVVLDIVETYEFVINDILGDVINPIFFNIGTASGENAPDWVDNPGAYEFTATISGGVVLNESVQMGDDGDMFAAFDDAGNVRGVAIVLYPPFGPYEGTPVYEMQMRSNAEGDVLHFKYYDASEDVVLDIVETYEFVINDILGNVMEPVFFNIGSAAEECVDDDAAVAPLGCASAVAALGCDGMWGDTLISDACPVTCDACPSDCADDDSLVSPLDCASASAALGCDGMWGDILISDACPETCGECDTECDDVDADGVCDDVDDCVGAYDECNICNGDNSSCTDCAGVPNGDSWESDCGCVAAGNSGDDCDDCAGTPNGDAELDECGVCNGGNADDLGCGCFEPGPSGCDNECGSTLEDDECGVCGGDNSSCSDCAGAPNGDSWESDCGCVAGNNSGDDCDDCNGVPNGSAELDDCGICGGDGSTCAPPDAFAFNQSTQQAFYFFMTASVDGESLDGDDWIGAFRNGYCSNSVATTEEICLLIGADWNPEEICVGARKWGDCDSDECDVPAMGVDGSNYTVGYMTAGVIPIFKIYDASEGEYLNAIPSEEFPWATNGMFVADSLENAIVGCSDMYACNYDENANIEGECSYPEDNYDCDGNCIITTDCAGECGGSAELDDCGICEGGNADDLGCGCFEPGPSGCDNECGSTLEDDECGVCGGDNSTCEDCAGVPNGSAELDDCGICEGGNADDLGCGCFEPGPSGCDNECGSTLEDDECGVCGGDNSTCEDCAGVPNGNSELDDCGVCEGGNADMDCAGECFGDAEIDECGDCGGDGIDEGECDCTGNVEDCAGECGGDTVVDGCGVCGGDNSTCDAPEMFEFAQSTMQAYYFFYSATIDGEELTSDDWVGAFNGETCVGARKWDTNICNGGVCDVPAMGDDDTEWTVGYMLLGDIPSFKIFDASENAYYDAIASEDSPWSSNELFMIDNVNVVPDCAGELGGDSWESDCGCVAGDNSGDDCDDCAGVPNGDSELDDCGVCDGGNADMDCAGECFGDSWESDCGCVAGDNSGDDCDDCAGVPNGDSELDDCGVCDGGNADMDCAGECFGDSYEDDCGTCDADPDNDCGQLSIDLDGLDLVSFHSLPENNSIENVLGGIVDSNPGVLGEGTSANYVDGQWLGTLLSIDPKGGYWIKVSGDTELNVEGLPTDPGTVFSLHGGSNLISYPFAGNAPLVETIPEAAQNSIIGIIGENVSAYNGEDGWIGGLMDLSGTEGYWFITSEDVDFSYNPPASDDNLTRQIIVSKVLPEAYTYAQSMNQAFYFVNSAEIDGEALTRDDLIIAYNNDVVVGARYWYGEATDIPAMGADGSALYAGYGETGDKISFKVLDASTNSLIEMDSKGDITWQNLGMSVIQLTNKVIPEEISFSSAYPNPFNPVTMISMSIPREMEVHVAIHDMLGREIAELANGIYSTGNYELQWDADSQASGIYFAKMSAGGQINIQKLMLIK